uniref:IncF plasmid conjugative transfer pilus assembly protein TraV n=1 Tax=Klebsiella pneumoniae TaxID=573 RepID=A0A8B0SUE8_KLEPN|nr:IncF plasmid conjugative transfer pilus assembly protein TraV [Klebsiella pneumoniae]
MPQLAEGNFRTTSVNSYPLPPQPNLNRARVAAERERARAVYLNNPTAKNEAIYFETGKRLQSLPVVKNVFTSSGVNVYVTVNTAGNYPRPLRKGEETTSLWIAPYVDSDDVYHQPATVLFVVKPSAWGQPRLIDSQRHYWRCSKFSFLNYNECPLR